MAKFDLPDGHEVRGMMIRIYPTPEQDEALRSFEEQSRSVWNWLVKQVEDVLYARAVLAVREGLVPPRPERPCYDGLSPDDASRIAADYGRAIRDWHGVVHKATKNHPGCQFRPFKDILAHFGAKYDYQLFQRYLSWRRETLTEAGVDTGEDFAMSAHALQAIAKNYFTKSVRRKKFRRRQDAMPIQVRSGKCFELGEFGARGTRGRNPCFYDCRVSLAGLKIRGRLPKRAPWGRVLEGVSVTRKADGWWASIKQVVPKRVLPAPTPGRVVGIDVGLVLMAATSEGLKIPNPRGAEYVERVAGRQAMGKPADRLQLQYARRTKHDLYTLLLKPLETAEAVKIEELTSKIGQMGSSKVSVMRLVRELLVGRLGERVREVDCRYTSQDCSRCGHRSKDSWAFTAGPVCSCPACGYREDRDVNAARNIAARPGKELEVEAAEKPTGCSPISATGRARRREGRGDEEETNGVQPDICNHARATTSRAPSGGRNQRGAARYLH